MAFDTFENLKKAGIRYLLTKIRDFLEATYGKVKTINGIEPNEYGDVPVNRVNYAGDLESSFSQTSMGEYIQRTSGGNASIEDGDAWLSILQGHREHDGYVAEYRDFNVYPVDEENGISATIDWDTFLGQVADTVTLTFAYTNAWNMNPVTYGITVTGTPANGDTMVVEYVKEERGTITQANPTAFVSTGWNLYMSSGEYQGYTGLARVVRYSDDYGYMIKGTHTALQFSSTLAGEKTNLTEADGLFQVPSDGFVWVVGGSSADTAIFPTHSDWSGGYPGDYQAYVRSVITLSDLMAEYFPFGLCQVENSRDEINLSLGTVTVRIERMEYDADNLAYARSSGRAFEYDADWIYIVKESISTISIPGEFQISGQYAASDHGLEFFEGTAVPVMAQTIYGANLKNKLERDVLTKSQQTLSAAEQKQARTNIGAAAVADITKITLPNAGSTLADNLSVPTGTQKTVAPITLNKGINIIVVTVSWQSNANGYRTAWLAATNDGGHANLSSHVTQAASSSGGIRQQLVIFRNVTSETETFYIRIQQNSGSALTASVRYSRLLLRN